MLNIFLTPARIRVIPSNCKLKSRPSQNCENIHTLRMLLNISQLTITGQSETQTRIQCSMNSCMTIVLSCAVNYSSRTN